ncbi:MAG: protein BatD [Bacteroidales bacterium]|nr:protein BatD [Bacteroidales bacterium]MDE7465140.1 hypothetical protein [Muribaculaceae bacterium]
MDNKEKHVRENEPHRDDAYLDQIANGLKANGKKKKNQGIFRSNRIWLWLGVIILIFILFWWIFSIGTAEDIVGTANG